MKAKILYMALALVLVFSLAAVVVPAGPAMAASPAFQDGGARLVEKQNNDGGWGWPMDGVSANNTIGPIGKGLAEAYKDTGNASMYTALGKVATFLQAKTNTFSPSDGYLAAELDSIFGVSTNVDHVNTYFYGPLAAGTYDRQGLGTTYNTSEYVNMIRTSRANQGIANLAAWDIGMGLVGAASAGVNGTELDYWIDGAKAEIDELDGTAWYDVIGLAGAVYGLAFVGEDFDPTAGEHEAASNLNNLADILASYQICKSGGFTWNSEYVIPDADNETIQETAYSILALAEVGGYSNEIYRAARYMESVQLGTGGWENYTGEGENNEVTAEALWGIAVAPTVSPSANTIASSTMHFRGTLTKVGGNYIGTIPATSGTYYITGGPGCTGSPEHSPDCTSPCPGGFDVYAKAGGTAYVEGIGSYAIGSDHDAYSSGGPWGTWYDPDCSDWNNYSLELTADHWYLRYTPTGESPMSGNLTWDACNDYRAIGYAAESDLGTQDGAHDGSAAHGGGAQAWDWDCGWGVEVIPLELTGFKVAVVAVGGGNYDVTLTPVGGGGGEGCFIATAAYGTESAQEIDVLRAFRDDVLLDSAVGSQIVEWYYQTSPPVADFISENGLLKTIVRELVIDPMVSVATFTQGIWGK